MVALNIVGSPVQLVSCIVVSQVFEVDVRFFKKKLWTPELTVF